MLQTRSCHRSSTLGIVERSRSHKTPARDVTAQLCWRVSDLSAGSRPVRPSGETWKHEPISAPPSFTCVPD